jgi:hypothetical protein
MTLKRAVAYIEECMRAAVEEMAVPLRNFIGNRALMMAIPSTFLCVDAGWKSLQGGKCRGYFRARAGAQRLSIANVSSGLVLRKIVLH